ncbi:alpha-1,2-fucosyltransferase [Escherichia coli]|nr:alpha-1,2-fucosyltransferase [Escherichia coli]
MKIVNIYGGLGNALFQVAFALYLSDIGHNVKIDTLGLTAEFRNKLRYFLKAYNISINECSYEERLRSSIILSRRQVKHKELLLLKFLFPQKIYKEIIWGELPSCEHNYYYGYFQNYELALKYAKIFSKGLNKIANENNFERPFTQDVFVHLRGGDYQTANAVKVHGLLDEKYYSEAFKFFESQPKRVFTNDKRYASKILGKNIFEYSEGIDFIYPDIADMYLMSRYANGIIANSTFSFWSAILGDNGDKKIICPIKWFADERLQKESFKIKPPHWIER